MSHVVSRAFRSLVVLVLLTMAAPLSAQVPTPEAFFGFKMGTDGRLADWPEIERYFKTVAGVSPRVTLVDIGTSTEGRHLFAALITSPENIKELDTIRAVNERLADSRGLAPEQARLLMTGQKVIVAIGASIHSAEIGATQMANELLHELATSSDARTIEIMKQVVVVLIPSLNPDGHAMVVDWFKKTKDTPFAGGAMPWLYQKYAGHDINRDAFMMNLAENRALARFFYNEWHPQVFLSLHQMGQNGPRMFVPPNYEPPMPNSDPLIWREAAVLGQSMALELERRGRQGVVSNALYDYYWPGYEDSAPIGHNTVCLLTEVASARTALPVTVQPADLAKWSGPGLTAYRPQVTFPNPWPGGAWRLRDIVDYELDAARGLLQAAAFYHEQLVEDFYLRGVHAVERARTEGPYAYLIPPEQRDPYAAARLTRLLLDGAVDVQEAQEPFRVGEVTYPVGTQIVFMAQPYRAYAKTLLERQDYPVRRPVADGPFERPYDVTGWTLPLQMGVRVERVDAKFDQPMTGRLKRVATPAGQVWGERKASNFIIDAPSTAGAQALGRVLEAGLTASWTTAAFETNGYKYPAGSIVLKDGRGARETVGAIARELGIRVDGIGGRTPSALRPIARTRIGLYKPWTPLADEGWTRFLLEEYRFAYRNLSDADIRAGALRATFDVIILPDGTVDQLRKGQPADAVSAEYAGGLGDAGVAALKAFVDAGGTLVCLGASGQLAVDALGLPVSDIVRNLPPAQFYCPGSLLRLDVDGTQPLGFGVQRDAAAFVGRGPVFDIDKSKPGADRARAVARFAAKDVLMSGWLEGESVIAGRPAVLEVGSGAGGGRVVLFSIRPQHRAQSLATFRFLFNALVP
jgi:hypothetical protein